ncbi:MAG: DUF1499 domain-containing protein [Allosphingosinicella sp.]|uniref:DUF1499 domain-containing protein n=1 Tax=Allosphingosinicella sp. TaxID=2823234 RepID=UPI00392C0058
MADGGKRAVWARRLTVAAAVLAFGGLAAALIAAVGSGRGVWHFRTGFTVLRWAFFAAIGGGVLAILAAFVARRTAPRLVVVNLLALAAAFGFVLFLGQQVRTARAVPPIHDIATDLDDPPRFEALTVRADNLENIPDMGRPELAALDPEARWKAVHREAYDDIRPLLVPWTVPETIARAERLARARGWEIARSDPEAGALEATDTTFFFRFKDDVALRVRPAPDGSGSLVDMRSISRVGVSDVGVNAKRIRAFLADLAAA